MIPWIVTSEFVTINVLEIVAFHIEKKTESWVVRVQMSNGGAATITACGTERKAKSIVAKLVKETASKVFDFTDSDVEE